MTTETQIESYLKALRTHLGPLTIAEREEIVREIGAHIRDSAEEPDVSVDSVLARLGPAEKLAAQYRDGLLISRASRSFSPLVLLRATLRLATQGVFGILVLFLGFFGYVTGGSLVLTGFAKCLFPAHTGTWVSGGDIVASGTQLYIPQPPAHEIFGMSYIPIALTLGSVTLLITTFAIRKSLNLSQRLRAKL
ncbi:MAG: hypothetical protein ABSF70_17450 [Terracidiphilus sp.]|jgi:uncharacterized membrane protein